MVRYLATVEPHQANIRMAANVLAGLSQRCYHRPAMIKAVFFDLYGTLAGFHPSRYEIQSEACADFGIQVTPEGTLKGYALADAYMAEQNTVRPLRQLDSESRNHFFAEYERLVLKGSDVEVSNEQADDIWRRVRRVRYQLTLYNDALPAMDELKNAGLTLGLISNMNRDGTELAESLGLAAHLDFAVTSTEVGAEKPHAPIFLAALGKAGAEPHQVVHVGDQPTSDVQGARGVGINPVLLDRDGNHKEVLDCPRIEDLTALPGVVASYQDEAGSANF